MHFKLSEYFQSFQGEGLNIGRSAMFFRFSGCNLNCTWCDTNWNDFVDVPGSEIDLFIKSCSTRFAVITGGEPTINPAFSDLFKLLRRNVCEIAVETNGLEWNKLLKEAWVTVSPKPSKFRADIRVLQTCREIKIVVYKDFDFASLKKFEFPDNKIRYRWLVPEFGNMEHSTKRIMNFIQINPQWRLGLQVHKWINAR